MYFVILWEGVAYLRTVEVNGEVGTTTTSSIRKATRYNSIEEAKDYLFREWTIPSVDEVTESTNTKGQLVYEQDGHRYVIVPYRPRS